MSLPPALQAQQKSSPIQTYIRNKSWWLYALLLAFAIYVFIGALRFDLNGEESKFPVNVMYMLEFGIHEAGHALTMFFPPVINALGGTIAELAFTALFPVASFFSRTTKSYFIGIYGLLWLMLAMRSVGNYMADARAQALPLVGIGTDDPIHDWNYIFGQFGWLEFDTMIGNAFRIAGVFIGISALCFGAYLVFRMTSYKSLYKDNG